MTDLLLFEDNLNITVKSTSTINCKEELTLITEKNKYIKLEINISADLEKIPEEYRTVFLNMMAARYCASVSYSDKNDPPFTHKAKKRKWYQIF